MGLVTTAREVLVEAEVDIVIESSFITDGGSHTHRLTSLFLSFVNINVIVLLRVIGRSVA
jgi:hypothetical protein